MIPLFNQYLNIPAMFRLPLYLLVKVALSLSWLMCATGSMSVMVEERDPSADDVPDGASETRPNVLMVVVDDMGWKDVGFHDPSFSTPHLDTLVAEGVEFSTFYTAPTCTPSRAQLMTGRYNFRTGMQDSVLHSTEPRGVPLTETFLGEKLQSIGYSTAMVGKWHLGMHMPQYVPQARGFEQFYGILTGGGGHYSHMSVSQDFTPRGTQSETRAFSGPNIMEGGDISPDSHGSVHSTELYTTKAVQYVTAMSERERPWFLYLSYQVGRRWGRILLTLDTIHNLANWVESDVVTRYVCE